MGEPLAAYLWRPAVGVALLLGFACGSVPFGQLLARLRGLDLRRIGSGNIGATNAARALGKAMGLLVLLLDVGKAVLPMFAWRHLHPGAGTGAAADGGWGEAALGFGAVLGHVFSPWMRFRGGKGVATGFGVFLVVAPLPALGAALVWVGCYAATRVSSIGSIIAACLLPLGAWLLDAPPPALALGALLCPLILVRHASNIGRLLRRQESRI